MGWLFKSGCSRRDLIAERTEDWERTTPGRHGREDDVPRPLLSRRRRSPASFGPCGDGPSRKTALEVQPTERWIGCDLLRSQRGFGWGYKDMDESMGPYFYSCPLKYFDLVPIEKFGGHAEWRATVRRYHQRQAEKRRNRFAGQRTPD